MAELVEAEGAEMTVDAPELDFSSLPEFSSLIDRKLAAVEGELVENYNRALKAIIDKETSLKSFHVDKRGVSPEISAELGIDYLQCGPANRYVIVVTPDQKDAGLLNEEYSFDRELFDSLYENYLPGIGVVTRVDSMYSELIDDVRAYRSFEDVLMLHRVSIAMKTPSGFMAEAQELLKRVEQLQNDPELLIKDDSSHLKRILELVRGVGDVRGYNVSGIGACRNIGTFFTRQFGGVYVFRTGEASRSTMPIKRPPPSPDAEGCPPSCPSPYPGESYPDTVVVHSSDGEPINCGASVKFIHISDLENILNFLLQGGWAAYSPGLLERRLSRLEDLALLEEGLDVAEMTYEKRQNFLNKQGRVHQASWYELCTIRLKVETGSDFETAVNEASPLTRCMLLKGVGGSCVPAMVVENLLTRLWPHDYERMLVCNVNGLEEVFDKGAGRLKKYISLAVKKSPEGDK